MTIQYGGLEDPAFVPYTLHSEQHFIDFSLVFNKFCSSSPQKRSNDGVRRRSRRYIHLRMTSLPECNPTQLWWMLIEGTWNGRGCGADKPAPPDGKILRDCAGVVEIRCLIERSCSCPRSGLGMHSATCAMLNYDRCGIKGISISWQVPICPDHEGELAGGSSSSSEGANSWWDADCFYLLYHPTEWIHPSRRCCCSAPSHSFKSCCF